MKVLGIDVGGTKIASALVNQQFRLSQLKVEATSQTDLLAQLSRIIAGYQGFARIALAVPGEVKANGLVQQFPNIQGFKPTNLQAYFQKQFKVPVSVINDAQAFSFAEALKGHAQKYNRVVGIILGTGIGIGFVINKKLYRGTNEVANVIGHLKFAGELTFEEVMQRSQRYTREIGLMAEALGQLAKRSLHPDAIVFGGGRLNDPVLKREVLRLTKILNIPVQVSRSNQPGIVGAVLVALKK